MQYLYRAGEALRRCWSVSQLAKLLQGSVAMSVVLYMVAAKSGGAICSRFTALSFFAALKIANLIDTIVTSLSF